MTHLALFFTVKSDFKKKIIEISNDYVLLRRMVHSLHSVEFVNNENERQLSDTNAPFDLLVTIQKLGTYSTIETKEIPTGTILRALVMKVSSPKFVISLHHEK